MALDVNVNGIWKQSNQPYVNVNGTWKLCNQVYVKVNGEWKPCLSQTVDGPTTLNSVKTLTVTNGATITVTGKYASTYTGTILACYFTGCKATSIPESTTYGITAAPFSFTTTATSTSISIKLMSQIPTFPPRVNEGTLTDVKITYI